MRLQLRQIMNSPRSYNWAIEARFKLSSAVMFSNISFFLEENKTKQTKENPPSSPQCRKKSLDWHFIFCKDLRLIRFSDFLSHLFLKLVLSPAKSDCSCRSPEITMSCLCSGFHCLEEILHLHVSYPIKNFLISKLDMFFPPFINNQYIHFYMSTKAFLIS